MTYKYTSIRTYKAYFSILLAFASKHGKAWLCLQRFAKSAYDPASKAWRSGLHKFSSDICKVWYMGMRLRQYYFKISLTIDKNY